MHLSTEHRSFLDAVIGFNERFNVVRAGDKSHALHLSFWGADEIERASGIQEEWELPKPLVPFYGDWHTVMCLDPRHGTILLLDDRRHVVFTWATTKEFVQCLASVSEVPGDTSGIIEAESWLDF